MKVSTNRVVMKAMIILLVFSCLLFSCSNNSREKSVDSSELSNIDYRLFQNTPAWELAKAVQEEDMDNFDKIISENLQIINYQESKYGNTLLMLTIINQQLKPFKALLKKGAAVNTPSNPQPIGFRGNLFVKRQKFFYCTYSLGITETS